MIDIEDIFDEIQEKIFERHDKTLAKATKEKDELIK